MKRRVASPELSRRAATVSAAVQRVGELALLAGRTFVRVFYPPLRLRATLYQIYVQGVLALGLTTVAGTFIGMALTLQFGTGLARFGAESILPQLTTLGLFRELVPVTMGLVVGGRLGAGIAAELGTMAVSEQLDALRVLGADPVRELAVPRVVAATVVLPLLTIYADLVGALGSIIAGSVQHAIKARFFVAAAREFIVPEDFSVGVYKAAGFGGLIGLLACYHGGRARGGADGVGRATTQTVVQGALSVIIIDYFLSRWLGPLLMQEPSA